MLQKNLLASQHYAVRLLYSVLFLCTLQAAQAWDGATPSAVDPALPLTSPDYNTILAEKISHSPITFNDDRQRLWDAVLSAPSSLALALRSEPGNIGVTLPGVRFSAGWELPLSDSVSTGPIAQYAVEQHPLACPLCDFSARPSSDQVASVGWRFDSQLGWLTPWAQFSYNHQLTEESLNDRPEQEGELRQDNNWLDVSVGAHLPLNNNLAAFASFSQTGALNSGEQFIYSLGVSASF